MSKITFSPRLKETTRLTTPEHPHANSVQVQLYSEISAGADYSGRDLLEDVGRGDVRVEIWTDAMPEGGLKDGDWRAVAFTVIQDDTHFIEENQRDTEHVLDLRSTVPPLPRKESSLLPSTRIQLTATLVLTTTPCTFAFTYRLVHTRTGKIEWLGNYGENGIVQLVAANLGPTVELKDPTDSSGSVLHDGSIGQLNLQSYRWKGWAISDSNVTTFQLLPATNFDPQGWSMLFLIPQALTIEDAHVLPQPLLFLTRNDEWKLHIDSSGRVTPGDGVSGFADISLYDSRSTEYADYFSNAISILGSGVHVLQLEPEHVVLATDSVPGIQSTIHILPLSSKSPSQISLSRGSFQKLELSQRSLLLFCESSSSLLVVSQESVDNEIVLRLNDSEGSNSHSFIATCVYDMADDARYRVAFLNLVSPPAIYEYPNASNSLPTPPSSPSVHAQRSTVASVAPSDIQIEGGQTLPLEDVYEPSIRGSPADERASDEDEGSSAALTNEETHMIHQPDDSIMLALRSALRQVEYRNITSPIDFALSLIRLAIVVLAVIWRRLLGSPMFSGLTRSQPLLMSGWRNEQFISSLSVEGGALSGGKYLSPSTRSSSPRKTPSASQADESTPDLKRQSALSSARESAPTTVGGLNISRIPLNETSAPLTSNLPNFSPNTWQEGRTRIFKFGVPLNDCRVNFVVLSSNTTVPASVNVRITVGDNVVVPAVKPLTSNAALFEVSVESSLRHFAEISIAPQ